MISWFSGWSFYSFGFAIFLWGVEFSVGKCDIYLQYKRTKCYKGFGVFIKKYKASIYVNDKEYVLFTSDNNSYPRVKKQ